MTNQIMIENSNEGFLDKVFHDIYSDNTIHFSSILYIIATPIGIMAGYSSMKLGLSNIKDPSQFHMNNFWIAFTSALIFACKIPYAYNKPLALTAFVCNLLIWFIACVIFTIALKKYITYKNNLTLLTPTTSATTPTTSATTPTTSATTPTTSATTSTTSATTSTTSATTPTTSATTSTTSATTPTTSVSNSTDHPLPKYISQ